MEEGKKNRIHAIIEGTVQGVGFRYFVQDAAHLLGITGWVRNRWDGSVEVMAEGEKEKLNQLLNALRHGPRSAHVMGVNVTWHEYAGEFNSFQIKQTSG